MNIRYYFCNLRNVLWQYKLLFFKLKKDETDDFVGDFNVSKSKFKFERVENFN